MASSYNDLHTRGWLRVITGTDAILPAGTRIHAVTVAGGAAAGELVITDAATAGAAHLQVNTPSATTTTLMLGPNGTKFTTGVSVAPGGTPDYWCIFYSEAD